MRGEKGAAAFDYFAAIGLESVGDIISSDLEKDANEEVGAAVDPKL